MTLLHDTDKRSSPVVSQKTTNILIQAAQIIKTHPRTAARAVSHAVTAHAFSQQLPVPPLYQMAIPALVGGISYGVHYAQETIDQKTQRVSAFYATGMEMLNGAFSVASQIVPHVVDKPMSTVVIGSIFVGQMLDILVQQVRNMARPSSHSPSHSQAGG